MLKIKGQPGLEVDLDLTKVFDQSNMVMEELYENLYNCSYPAFGGSMLRYDDQTIVATTCANRVLSKYQKPAPERTELLKAECYSDWISHEETLKLHNYAALEYTPSDREILRRASVKLRSWLYSCHKDVERALKGSLDYNTLEMTPGETFVSSEGQVSIYQKLVNRKYWTVTPDASESFIRLCYNVPWLKRVAKSHMKWLSREDLSHLYWTSFKKDAHVGYEIFRQRMLSEVLTVVHGSRGSSVEKNNEKRRFINVECLGNVILQRIVALVLRGKLKELGNDLEIGQQVHIQRISESISTIDFSNASDSILHDMIRLMWPTEMFKFLDRFRSPFCLIDGVYYPCKKLSSMGNGFTFEVMTITLLAVARVLDDAATVYGDDVIIANEAAEQFVRATTCMGMTVNEKKSFINARFRESCGGFYLDGYGYVTCYDFHYIEHITDLITTCNKLKLLLENNRGEFLHPYKLAYEALLRIVPSLFLGPCQHRENGVNDQWVETDKFIRSHMRDAEHRTLYQTLIGQVQQDWITRSFGLGNKINFFLSPIKKVVESTTAPRDIKYSRRRWALFSAIPIGPAPVGKYCDIALHEASRIRAGVARSAHYFYSLRRALDVRRVPSEDAEFELILHFSVSSVKDGQIVSDSYNYALWKNEQKSVQEATKLLHDHTLKV